MGLVLMKFIVERHFVQETVHLPIPSEKPSHPFLQSWAIQKVLHLLFKPASCLCPSTNLLPQALLKTAPCSSQLGLRILHLTHDPLTLQSWLSACFTFLSPPTPSNARDQTQGLAETGEALTTQHTLTSVTRFLSLLFPAKQAPGNFTLSLTASTTGT